MTALRVLLATLFLLSTESRLSAQIDLNAIEATTGRNMLNHLKMTASECKSAFISALNAKLFAAIVAKGIITKSPEVYIFDLRKINAFAFPSGKIILTSALLATLHSSNEYAAVILHEVGHIKLGHIRKNMIIEAARSLLFTNDALKLPVLLARLKYSRSEETEADEFAANALTKIGIAPANLGEALLRISTSASLSAKSDLFSTHPLTKNRIKILNSYRHETRVAGSAITFPAWHAVDLACQ